MEGNLAKLVAAALGVGLCLVALSAWRLPTSGSPPGLDLRLIAVPPGELTVAPTGVIASRLAMQSGDPPAHGELRVENIAGRPLGVHLVALPSDSILGRKVRLRVAGGGRTIATGALTSLEHPRGRSLHLPARGAGRIEVSAWMPARTGGYRGGILDVTLEPRAQPLGVGG